MRVSDWGEDVDVIVGVRFRGGELGGEDMVVPGVETPGRGCSWSRIGLAKRWEWPFPFSFRLGGKAGEEGVDLDPSLGSLSFERIASTVRDSGLVTVHAAWCA